MDLEAAKSLIRKYMDGHADFVAKASVAERYFKKQNDILYYERESEDNPLRNSDNRIPSNFYQLQVNQKAAYAFTKPPTFNAGDDTTNQYIQTTLGDAFAKKCKTLCIQAANSTIGWLHYWVDKDGRFRYAVIDSRQVIPVWTRDLERELVAVIRTYQEIDENDGKNYIIYEIWTSQEAQSYRRPVDSEDFLGFELWPQYPMIDIDSGIAHMESTYRHDFGEVPFIFFNNNSVGESDLNLIKELVDAYDKVYSGFLNDLDDIQELIFVLTNYSGEAEDTASLLKEMRTKKVITVESDGADDRSGVSTLAIDIPVEAREKMLALTRKAIFEQGMAIDPDPQNFGNSSGVALKYLYSLLELKTGLMETEFRISFNRLIRAILRRFGIHADNIVQTWTRTSVNNDAELADIAQKSLGVISGETIIRNHPWVDDAVEEIRRMDAKKKEDDPDWENVPATGDGNGG